MFTSTAKAWENKALMKNQKTQIKNPRHEVMFDYGVKFTSVSPKLTLARLYNILLSRLYLFEKKNTFCFYEVSLAN